MKIERKGFNSKTVTATYQVKMIRRAGENESFAVELHEAPRPELLDFVRRTNGDPELAFPYLGFVRQHADTLLWHVYPQTTAEIDKIETCQNKQQAVLALITVFERLQMKAIRRADLASIFTESEAFPRLLSRIHETLAEISGFARRRDEMTEAMAKSLSDLWHHLDWRSEDFAQSVRTQLLVDRIEVSLQNLHNVTPADLHYAGSNPERPAQIQPTTTAREAIAIYQTMIQSLILIHTDDMLSEISSVEKHHVELKALKSVIETLRKLDQTCEYALMD